MGMRLNFYITAQYQGTRYLVFYANSHPVFAYAWMRCRWLWWNTLRLDPINRKIVIKFRQLFGCCILIDMYSAICGSQMFFMTQMVNNWCGRYDTNVRDEQLPPGLQEKNWGDRAQVHWCLRMLSFSRCLQCWICRHWVWKASHRLDLIEQAYSVLPGDWSWETSRWKWGRKNILTVTLEQGRLGAILKSTRRKLSKNRGRLCSSDLGMDRRRKSSQYKKGRMKGPGHRSSDVDKRPLKPLPYHVSQTRHIRSLSWMTTRSPTLSHSRSIPVLTIHRFVWFPPPASTTIPTRFFPSTRLLLLYVEKIRRFVDDIVRRTSISL